MQGDETLMIMDGLRGRLVVEREASRAAKQNAELMEHKLKELEKQVKLEIELRRKAEKKLILLKNKLQGLNIPFNIGSDESEKSSSPSSSSFDSEMHSCISSTASNTCLNNQPISETSSSGIVENNGDSEINLELKFHKIAILQQVSKDVGIAKQQPLDANHDGKGVMALKMESKDGSESNEEEVDDDVDNTMALVIVESPVQEINTVDNGPHGVIQVNNDTVKQVLDTLHQIKQNIQTTIQRRRLIKVC